MTSASSEDPPQADGQSQTDDAPPFDAPSARSPCVQVCALDAQGVCVGCGRLIDEIVAWRQLTAEQQRSICEQAARRLAARL
jgi:predicted Fe-S protein YdhL (DUF1289 family)